MKSDRQKKERDENDHHNDSDIGVKGGMNVFNTVYKHQPAFSPDSRLLKPGLHLGMFFKVKLGKKTSLISELQYTRNLYSTIENPILFSYLLSNKRVSLEAGFHWGVVLSNYYRNIGVYLESTSNMVDLGLTGGIKYKLNDNIALGGRYFHATKDMFEWYDQGMPVSTEGYSRNFFFSVYYSF